MNRRQGVLIRELAAYVRRIAARPVLWEHVLFIGLAVYITWPLAGSLSTAIPLGTERIATVPLFNLWTVWWNTESAAGGFLSYWQAPIFFPAADSFAFSETQLPTVITAPIAWLARSPIPAYNVYLLGSLAASGWVGCLLLRRVGLRDPSAILGGILIEMLPFVHWQLGVLQLVPLWGILWTFCAVLQFAERPSARCGLNIGAAITITYLLCHHYGLFLSVLLLLATGWLWGRRLGDRRTWLALLPGGLLVGLVLGPWAFKQSSVMREYRWTRNPALVRSLSAELADYAVAPWSQRIPTDKLSPIGRRINWKLSPGTITFILAFIGLINGFANRRQRAWTAFCLTILAAAVMLSFGPKFRVGPVCVYDFLVGFCPGFAQVRNVFRFAVFAQIAVACLAASGLDAILTGQCRQSLGKCWYFWNRRVLRRENTLPPITECSGDNRTSRFRPIVAPVIVIGIGLLAAFDVQPPRQQLHQLPSRAEQGRWAQWLADNTDSDAIIVCLPVDPGHTVYDYEPTAQWMYWQTLHHRRMVNGYSGFFPADFLLWRHAMRSYPDDYSIEELRRLQVTHCVVGSMPNEIGTLPAALTLVYRDTKAKVDIYELQPDRLLNRHGTRLE